MILTRKSIQQKMEQGLIKIDGYNPDNLGVNSYDLTLGTDFWLVSWGKDKKPLFCYHKNNMGDSVPTYNNHTILAWSNEYVWTGDGIVVSMRGRSSTRRSGISVCMDAGLGDVGFGGQWVVELSGHAGQSSDPCPYLVIGETFCQLVFEQADPLGEEFYSGQYGNGASMVRQPPHMMLPKAYRSEKYTCGYDWGRYNV